MQLLASRQAGAEGTRERRTSAGARGGGSSREGLLLLETTAGTATTATETGALQGRLPGRLCRWPRLSSRGDRRACCALQDRLLRAADRSSLALVADLSRMRCSVGSLHAEGSHGRAASEALPTALALSAFTSDEGDGALLGAHGRAR